jgi:hypothetical protein
MQKPAVVRTARVAYLSLFALVTVLCYGGSVHAGPVAYVAGLNGAEFGTMDLTTGQFYQISTTLTNFTEGMGFTPQRQLYSIQFENDGTDHVVQINPQTGATTDVGSLGPGIQVNNGTTDRAGNLYAIDDITGTLYKINPQTLAVTSIGNTGFGSANNANPPDGLIAFDRNGNLYADQFEGYQAGGKESDLLYQINPQTGQATPLPDPMFTNPGFLPNVYAGVFAGNTLYGFGNQDIYGNTNIYTIDITTGAATFVTQYYLPNSYYYPGGPLPQYDVVSAAALAPEPPSLLLIALGAGALRFRRYWARSPHGLVALFAQGASGQ